MSDPRSALRSLMAMVAGALLVAVLLAPGASADPYGELSHFGEKGTGLGQFNEAESDLGVDPADNSVYAVDTVPNKGNKESKPTFRLQKFVSEAGKYKAVASIEFKPAGQENSEPDEIEGVAVDTALKRVYVLASQPRPKEPDEEEPAAAVLFAFSTEQSGSKLVDATGVTDGVLAEQKVLLTESKTPGAALLRPSGIAVDPVTHDVIIVGAEDPGKNQFGGNGSITVVQRIHSNGTLGAKWVDETNGAEGFFEECECVNSPAVSSSGNVYVLAERDDVFEIPASFSGKEAPLTAFAFECTTEPACPMEALTEFPGFEPGEGAQMSFGSEGHLYIRSRISNEKEQLQQFDGALVLKPGAGPNVGETSFTEVGWTGGQSPASGAGKCVVPSDFLEPAIAAGSGETFFMLARPEAGSEIVQFGPNGAGCPKATATTPSAEAGGVATEPFAEGESVTLSSKVEQANALSTVWEFTNVATKSTTSTETKRQQQTTEVKHVFAESGEFTVTEKIHTDDLTTPLIEKTRKVKVVGAPTVVTEEATVEGVSATANGTVDPNGQEVTKCEFKYGETEAYGSVASCATLPGKGEAPVKVKAVISAGLVSGKTYHFRLFATSGKGTGEGADRTFTTTLTLPVLGASSASSVTEHTATLNNTVNPKGLEVTACEFKYGTNTEYTLGTLPCVPSPVGSGTGAVKVSANVTGLNPGTTYHFTLVAKNANGKAQAVDAQFKTLAKPFEPPPEQTPIQPVAPSGPPPPQGGTLPEQQSKPPASPVVTLLGSAATVSSAGAFTLKLSCPATETTCVGSLSLRTLKAVVAAAGHEAKSKAAILTLASGSFSVAGGQVKAITLHLSSKARSLLAHSHSIAARATILAHDPLNATHTTVASVTLHAAKPSKHH